MECSTGDMICISDVDAEEDEKDISRRTYELEAVDNQEEDFDSEAVSLQRVLFQSPPFPKWRIETPLQIIEKSDVIEDRDDILSVDALSTKNSKMSIVADLVVTEKSVQSQPAIMRNKKTSTDTLVEDGDEFTSVTEVGGSRQNVEEQSKLCPDGEVFESKFTDVLLDQLILEVVSSMRVRKKGASGNFQRDGRLQRRLFRSFELSEVNQEAD